MVKRKRKNLRFFLFLFTIHHIQWKWSIYYCHTLALLYATSIPPPPVPPCPKTPIIPLGEVVSCTGVPICCPFRKNVIVGPLATTARVLAPERIAGPGWGCAAVPGAGVQVVEVAHTRMLYLPSPKTSIR